MNECWHTEPAHRPSAPAIVKRLSRIARKYNFAIPTASSALLPSASVRQFFTPASSYESLEDDLAEVPILDESEKGKEKVIDEAEVPEPIKRSVSVPPKDSIEKAPRYASTIERLIFLLSLSLSLSLSRSLCELNVYIFLQ